MQPSRPSRRRLNPAALPSLIHHSGSAAGGSTSPCSGLDTAAMPSLSGLNHAITPSHPTCCEETVVAD